MLVIVSPLKLNEKALFILTLILFKTSDVEVDVLNIILHDIQAEDNQYMRPTRCLALVL